MNRRNDGCVNGRDSYMKRTGCSSYLLEVKNEVLVALKALSLKRSSEVAFKVSKSVEQKKHGGK